MTRFNTIVITGGSGFVGKYLIQELRPITQNLVVWDTKTGTFPSDVASLAMDITQPVTYEESLEALKPDWIIHLAAIASVPYAIEHPEKTKAVNVDGTRKLLQTAQIKSPATKIFVVSSSDIYGHQDAGPIAELPLYKAQPSNPYAESKLEMERMIERDFLDSTIRVRPFVHIGPGQALGFVTADFASQIAAIERGGVSPVMKVGNLTSKRDFTDVRDVVRAYRLLLQKGVLGEVYNIGSGAAVSIQHVLDLLLTMARVPIKVETDQARMRPSDVPVIVGDAGKLRQATGWKPEISLEQSLRDILDYFRKAETS